MRARYTTTTRWFAGEYATASFLVQSNLIVSARVSVRSYFRGLVRNRTTSIFLRASVLNAWREKNCRGKNIISKWFLGIFRLLEFRFRFLDRLVLEATMVEAESQTVYSVKTENWVCT